MNIFKLTIISFLFVVFIPTILFSKDSLVKESPEIINNLLRFSEGVKGECLKGATKEQTSELFSWVSAPSAMLGIKNCPQPILNSKEGSISLWINHTSPYFYYKNIFDTSNRRDPQNKNRIKIDVGPFQSGRSTNADPERWMGGRISATIYDEAGKKTSLKSSLIEEGSWYHIVLTWNAFKMRLYINGREFVSKDKPSIPDLSKLPYFYLNRTFSGDLDEVMIFDQVLSSDKVISLYEKNDLSSNQNLVFYMSFDGNSNYLVRRHDVRIPDMIDIYFPDDSHGYFPLGYKLPIKIIFPADAGKKGKYEANISLLDLNNSEVFASKKSISASISDNLTITESIKPQKCGLYWVKVCILNGTGKIIKQKEFPFGVTVNLLPITSVDESSPLGGQPLVDNHMPEGRLLGMKWDRFWKEEVSWQNIEPEPGLFFWNYADRCVNEAKAAGNEILFTIHGVPDWASSAPPDKMIYEYLKKKNDNDVELWKVGRSRRFYPPKDIKHWDRFVRELVRRYKDRIHHWEILNEPNAQYFMSNDNKARDYILLLKAAYKAIHEEDSTAKVIGIDGCPSFLPWTEEVLKGGGGSYFDILSVHNYNYSSPITWSRLRLVEKAKQLLIRYTGRVVPIWNTERGIGQVSRINKRPMTETDFILKYGDIIDKSSALITTEHRSACWEIQAHLLDFAAGVQKIILHSGYGVSELLNMRERFPTEKGVAYAAMAKVVTKMKSAKRLDLKNSLAAGVLIQDTDDICTAALFADDEVWVYFKVKKDKVFNGMDYLGNPLTWKSENGFLALKLGIEPVYIFNVNYDFKITQLLNLKNDMIIKNG